MAGLLSIELRGSVHAAYALAAQEAGHVRGGPVAGEALFAEVESDRPCQTESVAAATYWGVV
jgi:hypothetical protein